MVPWRVVLALRDDVLPGQNIHVLQRIGLHFYGEVPTRLNLATMEDEYYLELDFTNTNMDAQWLTVGMIQDAVTSARAFEKSLGGKQRKLMNNPMTIHDNSSDSHDVDWEHNIPC